MQHWKRGQQLHKGKYLIEEILGGGGFGVTYRAQNRKENKLVAIKTLNANVQGKPNFREHQTKFLNEALSLAKCSHPHVVQVYEVFSEMAGNIELWCMVMELIEGVDLASHLEDNGILSQEKALPIIQQVGDALSFVHKQNITHRDVKPLNIMLRQQNLEAVLIDFGLARELTLPGKLRSSSVFGTECFAPIEQYQRQAERGPYTDVYSLAVTLYVMLTGELPCPSRYRKPVDPLIPPKQFNSRISDRVNAAIIKGMELEPQNRPQSVQEWLDLVMPKQAANLVMPKQAANEVQLVIPKQAANEVQLVSAVGMDYRKLRDLLAAGKWREADGETAGVMLKVAGREKEEYLDESSIDNFPCEDLRTIDQLWVRYSNGRFGFSVQKPIYQSLGGTREYDPWKWKEFGARVGWCVVENKWFDKWFDYCDLKFNSKAPEGHLPVRCVGREGWAGWAGEGEWSVGEGGGFTRVSSLVSRVVKCNI
ncbi:MULTISPECIES: serine/threonine-protein kinase [unclassified Microcoleus]|uniref:serine/threonine-protein kinase n=1 Tax=unclassified Microcoleus TaxID=2642155 RepID=UPI0025E68068|nr:MULTISPECIES: serine/threonine-protein kinase [unclassified Microcoleus]